MDDIWDPERIETIGRIVTRYSEHLQVNDRIRVGVEGDPCTLYRSVECIVAAHSTMTNEPISQVPYGLISQKIKTWI